MGNAAVAHAPRREREVFIVTTHPCFGYARFNAGADDPLASLRAVVSVTAWPHRDDFELRVIDAGTDALHEAFDLHWCRGRPIATPEDAGALPEEAVIMAWTPQQWEGGACTVCCARRERGWGRWRVWRDRCDGSSDSHPSHLSHRCFRSGADFGGPCGCSL